MKNPNFKPKLFFCCLVLMLIIAPTLRVSAENLNATSIQTVYPSLNQALNNMLILLLSLQTEIRREDMVLENSSLLLRSYARTMSASTPPSLPVLFSMAQSISDIKNDLAGVQNMQVTITTSLSGMTKVLRNIMIKISAT